MFAEGAIPHSIGMPLFSQFLGRSEPGCCVYRAVSKQHRLILFGGLQGRQQITKCDVQSHGVSTAERSVRNDVNFYDGIMRPSWMTSQNQGDASSGAGTNLKVGSPVRSEAPEIFFGRAPPLFGSKSTISRFGERFSWWSVQFGQFLVCCSPTHGSPRAQSSVKAEGTCPVPHGVGSTGCECRREGLRLGPGACAGPVLRQVQNMWRVRI